METNRHPGMAKDKKERVFERGEELAFFYLFDGGIGFDRFIVIRMKVSDFPILRKNETVQFDQL